MKMGFLLLMKPQKVFFNAETAKIAEAIVFKYNKFMFVSGRILEQTFASSTFFVAKPGFRQALKFLLFTKLSLLPILFLSFCDAPDTKKGFPKSIAYEDITIQGELQQRVLRNFDRLEGKRYTPEKVFLTEEESGWWAGDTEGRTILALTLLSQSSKREAKYLEQIIDKIPEKLNKKGYLGTIWPDTVMHEQQLSGHGWFLRGLCEYYQWKNDSHVLDMIKTIVDSLVLPTAGYHKLYPIDPSQRQHTGKYSGTSTKQIGNWILSSDIGCDFIFLDGVTHAYEILRTDKLKDIIEEMIPQYLKMDLVTIKAQTHATLTGLRAILRYYAISGDSMLLENVIQRYDLYINEGITENYENYNWFGRPKWTEPCAIIDSYIVAVTLWKHTGNTKYLEDAHHIYYNAIAHDQMARGGFACNSCSGANNDAHVEVKVDDVWWCCNMRGGEGLSCAVKYSFFTEDNTVIIPFFQNCTATVKPVRNKIKIEEKTDYPFGGNVEFKILKVEKENKINWKILNPSYENLKTVLINEKSIDYKINKGMISFKHHIKEGDIVKIEFEPKLRSVQTLNKHSIKNYFTFRYGPLILGHSGKDEVQIPFSAKLRIETKDNKLKAFVENDSLVLQPLYHLLSPEVKKNSYSMQVIFKNK